MATKRQHHFNTQKVTSYQIFKILIARLLEALPTHKFNYYHAYIDKQAEEMFSRLVKQLAEKENVTEKLKAENQMLWVQRMNNIRNRAREIVDKELIYTV